MPLKQSSSVFGWKVGYGKTAWCWQMELEADSFCGTPAGHGIPGVPWYGSQFHCW